MGYPPEASFFLPILLRNRGNKQPAVIWSTIDITEQLPTA